jgi:hypothetical protein
MDIFVQALPEPVRHIDIGNGWKPQSKGLYSCHTEEILLAVRGVG